MVVHHKNILCGLVQDPAQQPIGDSSFAPPGSHATTSDEVPNTTNAGSNYGYDDSGSDSDSEDGFVFYGDNAGGGFVPQQHVHAHDHGPEYEHCGRSHVNTREEQEGDGMASGASGPGEDAGDHFESYPLTSDSDLPACFKGHTSLASLVEASEEFASKKGFSILVKPIKYFAKRSDEPVATDPPPNTDAPNAAAQTAAASHTPEGGARPSSSVDLSRIASGYIRCVHFGEKRVHAPSVSATKQRNKPSQKLGCGFHIHFKVAEEGGSPEVGFPNPRADNKKSFDMAHTGHVCHPSHAQYVNRTFSTAAWRRANASAVRRAAWRCAAPHAQCGPPSLVSETSLLRCPPSRLLTPL